MSWQLSLCLSFLVLFRRCLAVPRFEAISVTDTSLVIKMVKGENISSFDMTVQIFDLDRLVEYRKTELKGSTKDQLFSFDGLTASTWFAFRIHYKLHYEQANVVDSLGPEQRTKQELIVRTKSSSRQDPSKVNDTVAFIDDLFLTKESIYIGVASVFKNTKKVITVIVPELKCSNGVLKPLAQQVIHHASFHFDVSLLSEDSIKTCTRMCIFPFVRVAIQNRTSETFRGKEWCGNVEEAKKLVKAAGRAGDLFMIVLIGTMIWTL